MKHSVYFLFPPLVLASGLGVLFFTENFKIPGVSPAQQLFSLFLILNLLIARFLGVHSQLLKAWSLLKSYKFFFGLALGGIPLLTTYYYLHKALPKFGELEISAILGTLTIVAWEELWFRGVALEIAGRIYGRIRGSLIFACFFILVHFINPEFSFQETGVGLFFAGYSLSLSYFFFKTIWVPLGMHFANNFLETQMLLEFPENHPMYLASIISISFVLTCSIYFRNDSN